MHNKLTKVDIQKMQAEIEERIGRRAALLEEVQRTREYGDLSENAEYKLAKQEKNKNESRIRYLKNMIDSAVIISTDSAPDEIGLFDTVTLYVEEDDEEIRRKLVTTLRTDSRLGLVSNESPLGKALLGHKVGDRITVQVNATYRYDVIVRAIEKGEDDDSLPISTY
jgi:transcription elongation factor GreA